MKMTKLFTSLYLLTIFLYSEPVVVEKIFAEVNGEIITKSEFDKNLVLFYRSPEVRQQNLPLDEAKSIVISNIIDQMLLRQTANEQGIFLTGTDISNYILNEVVAGYGIENMQQLEQELAGQGVPFEFFFKSHKNNYYMRELMGRSMTVIEPGADEVRQFYDSNKSSFLLENPMYDLHQIVFYKNDDMSFSALLDLNQKAKSVLSEIENGLPFEEAARKYSQDSSTKASGGSLGWLLSEEIPPYLRSAMEGLGKDDLSKVINGPEALYIIWVKDLKKDGYVPYDKAKNYIKNNLALQKRQEELDKRLSLKRKRSVIVMRDGQS